MQYLKKEIKNIKNNSQRVYLLRTMYNKAIDTLHENLDESTSKAISKAIKTLCGRQWKLNSAHSGLSDDEGTPYMNNWKVLELEFYYDNIKFTLNSKASLDILKFRLRYLDKRFKALPKKIQYMILNLVVYKRMLELCDSKL